MIKPTLRKPDATETLTLEKMEDVAILLRQQKPGDRSDRDRYVAICISEFQKFCAIYTTLILGEDIINE